MNYFKLDTIRLIIQIPNCKKFIMNLKKLLNYKKCRITIEYLIDVVNGKKEFNLKNFICKRFIKNYKEQFCLLINNKALNQLDVLSKLDLEIVDEIKGMNRQQLYGLIDKLQKLDIDEIRVFSNKKFDKVYQHFSEGKIYTYLQNMVPIDSIDGRYLYKSDSTEYEIKISSGPKGQYVVNDKGIFPYLSEIVLTNLNIDPNILPNSRKEIIDTIQKMFGLSQKKESNDLFTYNGSLSELVSLLIESYDKLILLAKEHAPESEKIKVRKRISCINKILSMYGYNLDITKNFGYENVKSL